MTVRPLVTLRILLVLGVALAMFFVAFFGDDGFNNMPQTEVATVTSFLEKAVPGPVYDPIADAPLADTARYNQFPTTDIFGAYGITGGASATRNIANTLASFALRTTRGRTPAYVVVTPGMVAYSQAYGAATPRDFTTLLTALAQSRAWKLVINRAGTVIYELPPADLSKPQAQQRNLSRHGKLVGLCKTQFEEIQANGSVKRGQEGLQRPSVVGEENPPRLEIGNSAFHGSSQGTDLIIVIMLPILLDVACRQLSAYSGQRSN